MTRYRRAGAWAHAAILWSAAALPLAGCGGGGSGGGSTTPTPPPTATEPSILAVSPSSGATGVDSLATFSVTVKMPSGESADPTQAKLVLSCAGEIGDRTLRNPTAAASGDGTLLTFGQAMLPYGGKTCTPKFTLGYSKGVYVPSQVWTVATSAVPVITKMAFDGYPLSLYIADPSNYAATKVRVTGIATGTRGCKPAYQKATGLFLAHCNKGEVFAIHPDGKSIALAVTAVTTPRLTGDVATWNDTITLKGGGAGIGDGESYVTVYKNGIGTKVMLPFGKSDDWIQGMGVNNAGLLYAVSRRGKVATVDLTAGTMTSALAHDASANVTYTNLNTTSGEMEISVARTSNGTDWLKVGASGLIKVFALPSTGPIGNNMAGPIAQYNGKTVVTGEGGLYVYAGDVYETNVKGAPYPRTVKSCEGKLFAARTTELLLVSGDLTTTSAVDNFSFADGSFEIVEKITCTN